MGKTDRKVLYIICEGDSDDITLHSSLGNYFRQRVSNIKVEITNGDIAYKDNINSKNCVDYIEKLVTDHKKKYFLFNTDFIAIVHIIDTDGAFIESSSIVQNNSIERNVFSNGKLHTNNKEYMSKRFDKKKDIYKTLYHTDMICGIKYYKFYFSRNLEHALYGIENASLSLKKELSNSFDEKYSSSAEDFEKKLKETMNNVPCDYEKSWDYIFESSNSTERCSNISILLEVVKREVLNKKWK